MNCWPSRSESHWANRRANRSLAPPGESRRQGALAASDRLAPARCAKRPAAPQRPRPNAEIVGGKVSFSSSACPQRRRVNAPRQLWKRCSQCLPPAFLAAYYNDQDSSTSTHLFGCEEVLHGRYASSVVCRTI